MFYGCRKINYIKALFTTNPTADVDPGYTYNWVSGVAASGVFIKNPNAKWTDTGTYAVPVGWRVETTDISPKPVISYNNQTFTVSAIGTGTANIYVDSSQVTNPYTIQQPMYNADYNISADNTEAGKPASALVYKTISVPGYKTPDPVIAFVSSINEVSATGEGTVLLYVDGVQVTNPYTLPGSGTYTATATAQDTGKQISNTVSQEVTYQEQQAGYVSLTVADMANYFGWTNSTDNVKDTDWTINGFTFRFELGTGTTPTKYYSTGGGALRIYKGNTFTISAGGKTITKIVIGVNGATYKFIAGDCSQATMTYDETFTSTAIFDFGSGVTTANFTNSSTTASQRRPNQFDIYYE